MKPKHFVITEDTPPDFETDEAKWWLCEKGEKYAIWRWDSKIKEGYKLYLLQKIEDNKIVAEDHTIEGIGIKFDLFERFY